MSPEAQKELDQKLAVLQQQIDALTKERSFEYPLGMRERRIVNRDLPVVKSIDTTTDIWTVEVNDIEHTMDVSGGAGGSPGGSSTQVQFNDGGAFGGDAGFTWDKTNDILTVGIAGAFGSIKTPTGGAGVNGGSLLIETGVGGTSDGTGGDITIGAGDGGATDGAGGSVQVNAGDADGAGDGGLVTIISGAGENGGNITVIAGNAQNAGQGGNVTIYGGTNTDTNGLGGNITLAPGGGDTGGSKDGEVAFEYSAHTTTYAGLFATTTNATPASMEGVALTVPSSSLMTIHAKVYAIRTGGSSGVAQDSASYYIIATYKRVGAAAPTLVGSITNLYTAEDQSGWDATFVVSSNDIQIQVTGAGNNTIDWVALVEYVTK